MWLHNCPGEDEPIPCGLCKQPRWSFAHKAIPVIISKGTSGWPGQSQPQPVPSTCRSQPITITRQSSAGWVAKLVYLLWKIIMQRYYWLPSPQAGQALIICLDTSSTGQMRKYGCFRRAEFQIFPPLLKGQCDLLSLWFISLAFISLLHMVLISHPFSDDATKLNDTAIVTQGWQH